MSRVTSSSSRRALVIFAVLSFLFCAQMTWWIIFQYSSAGSTRKFLTQTLEEHLNQTLNLINSRFLMAGKVLQSSSSDLNSIYLSFADIISGVTYAENLIEPDLSDSLFLTREKEGRKYYVFFNSKYPQILISGDSRLAYSAPRGEVRDFNWVTAEHIKVRPETYREIDSERNRHARMFMMEGSFFLILIIIGGYMIFLSLKRLKQTREEQLLFIHSITHELKIPITSINLFIDTMKRRKFDPKIVSELAPKMKEDLIRLNQLIDNILQVRRLADGQVDFRIEKIDLSRELHQFGERIKERIEAAGGKLNLEVEEKIGIEAGLPELIRVWELLIDNSLKYGKSGNPEIGISLNKVKETAEISFYDNGPGIPEGMEKELFEPFFRGNIEEKKTVPGSGLGLYIAREFVRRQGGSINIRNGAQGGAVVTMRFKVS